MLQNYRLVWGLLNSRERRQFIILLLLSTLMALFEVVGVAAILPFLIMPLAIIMISSFIKMPVKIPRIKKIMVAHGEQQTISSLLGNTL